MSAIAGTSPNRSPYIWGQQPGTTQPQQGDDDGVNFENKLNANPTAGTSSPGKHYAWGQPSGATQSQKTDGHHRDDSYNTDCCCCSHHHTQETESGSRRDPDPQDSNTGKPVVTQADVVKGFNNLIFNQTNNLFANSKANLDKIYDDLMYPPKSNKQR